MKAIVKTESAKGLSFIEVLKPTPLPHEVLIKTIKTSICGTDLHIYKWDAWAQKNVPVPLIIGHEFMGQIAELGSQVKNLKIGDRVSGEGHIVCNECLNCKRGLKHLCARVKGLGYHRSGCFTEYFTLPAENVFLLPDTVSDDMAAIFDPFGNTVHTALYYPLTGEDVLITGAGPIGIMAAAIAKHAGARSIVITDTNEYRLNLAKKMSTAETVNVSKESLSDKIKELKLPEGFTVGLEMSGHPAGLNQILESMQHGGKVALLGIIPPGTLIDWDLVIFKMLTLQGIYGRQIFGTWEKMVSLLESGLDLKDVITHQFKAEDYQQGIDLLLTGQSGKVILNW